MLSDVDDFIKARLGSITFNKVPIPVYPYIPDREKGKTKYPCYAFVRHQISIREADKKPDIWLMIPSQQEITVNPDINNGEAVSGPPSYIAKPYPTPVDLIYEVMALSTKEAHNNYLLEMLLQAFPPGYIAQIGDYYPLFYHTHPIIGDDLRLPLYKTSFILEVTDFWIDRLEARTVPSITDIQFTGEPST